MWVSSVTAFSIIAVRGRRLYLWNKPLIRIWLIHNSTEDAFLRGFKRWWVRWSSFLWENVSNCLIRITEREKKDMVPYLNLSYSGVIEKNTHPTSTVRTFCQVLTASKVCLRDLVKWFRSRLVVTVRVRSCKIFYVLTKIAIWVPVRVCVLI